MSHTQDGLLFMLQITPRFNSSSDTRELLKHISRLLVMSVISAEVTVISSKMETKEEPFSEIISA